VTTYHDLTDAIFFDELEVFASQRVEYHLAVLCSISPGLRKRCRMPTQKHVQKGSFASVSAPPQLSESRQSRITEPPVSRLAILVEARI
jgi:hypothetical protein